MVIPSPLKAESVFSDWIEDVGDTKWETAAAFAGVTTLGIVSWEWGSSKSFRWNPEGFFGMETGSGGADKLGHAFTSYACTNIIADRLEKKGRSAARAGLSAAITTQLILLYVELFDAYSLDHGFAWEDCVMNLGGSGFAVARNAIPGLRDLVDYRMEYEPSGYNGFRPISDYPGQKYLLALKLSGIDRFSDTPLRYLELHGGYYTRGFSKEEELDGLKPQRYGFVGVGINLGELLLGHPKKDESDLRHAGRMFFEHIQIPYTSVHSSTKL
ncbi:MAG: DUF2279 domain-containing protein [Chlorobium sp.]|jgi:hypothetical protein|nr:DUF2279 domain-containing protein [Chlorobium sp.]